MTLDEAIWRETALAESFRRRIESMETTDTKPLERMEQEHRQFAEWLRELKAYRGILANADRLIESEYGVVIIEGYKDVIDQMNEVFMEVKADEDSD